MPDTSQVTYTFPAAFQALVNLLMAHRDLPYEAVEKDDIVGFVEDEAPGGRLEVIEDILNTHHIPFNAEWHADMYGTWSEGWIKARNVRKDDGSLSLFYTNCLAPEQASFTVTELYDMLTGEGAGQVACAIRRQHEALYQVTELFDATQEPEHIELEDRFGAYAEFDSIWKASQRYCEAMRSTPNGEGPLVLLTRLTARGEDIGNFVPSTDEKQDRLPTYLLSVEDGFDSMTLRCSAPDRVEHATMVAAMTMADGKPVLRVGCGDGTDMVELIMDIDAKTGVPILAASHVNPIAAVSGPFDDSKGRPTVVFPQPKIEWLS